MSEPEATTPSSPGGKQYWRAQGKAVRCALAPEARATAAQAVCERLMALPELRAAQTVAAFASTGDELDTHGVIAALLAAGKRVVLPRVVALDEHLVLHRITRFPEGFVAARLGILEPHPEAHPELVEPEELDVVLVPGVVYDRARFRIGYGAGHYDRLLTRAPQARAIGLAFQCQVIKAFEHEAWDKPVDLVCTEAEIF